MISWLRTKLKQFARFLGFGFYAIVAIFLGIYISNLDWQRLSSISVNWGWLLLATLIGIATRFWFAKIWVFFLNQSGHTLTKAETIELYKVYAKSWLGRYIPGSVAWVAGKVYFASKLGISKSRLAISSFIEAVLQIVTVLLTASLLLVFDPRSYQLAGGWLWLVIGFAILGFVALLPPVLRIYASAAYNFLRKAQLDQKLIPGNKTLGAGILMFVVSSMLSGFAFYLVTLAIAPEVGIEQLLFILAASNLASAISMVAIFAPAGVGVREAIQIAALVFVMSPEQALAAALMMRVLSILWDGFFLALATTMRTGK